MCADRLPARPLSRRSLVGGGTLALATTAFAFASPGRAHAQQTITTNQTGTHDGYFYAFSTDVEGTAAMTLGPQGSYNTTWSGSGSFLSGKGWTVGGPGNPRSLGYTGNVSIPEGEASLCVHGWTVNPLVEYFIVDFWGPYRPMGEYRGTIQLADGGTYDLYQTMRYNAPSPDGIQTFPQYWSVRTTPRLNGTIDTGVHFDAWARAGMMLGTFVPGFGEIIAMVGHQSSGTADITVN